MMRIVIAGSRDFDDEAYAFAVLDKAFGGVLVRIECVISGNARGADRIGEKWAKARGFTEENGKLKVMPADWGAYGPSAGHRRNEQMGQICSHAIIFWDGLSKGTKGMIDYCLKHERWLKVVYYKKG